MNKVFIVLAMLFCISFSLSAQTKNSSYFEWMNEKGISPKEYIMKAFEDVDVIVLGERDHRDTTQYNLILDLLADPRFIEQVGYVYTEVGVVNMTESANKLIKGSYSSYSDFYNAFLAHYRNEDFNPLWEKYNRKMLLEGLYHINNTLPKKKKITIGLTDCAFQWDKCKTPIQYRKFDSEEVNNGRRDQTMSQNFLNMYKKQNPRSGKRKALLITNSPHALMTKNSEGYILKKELGDNMKVVVLNWYYWYNNNGLHAGGAWDAAFEKYDKKAVAFDLKGSPYSECIYNSNYTWGEIADGIIYDIPYYEFVAKIGVSGAIDNTYIDEHLRRCWIVRKASNRFEGTFDEFIQLYKDPDEYDRIENEKRYYNTERIIENILEEELRYKMAKQLKEAVTSK